MKLTNLVRLFFLGSITLSFAAQAELQIQNAQYKSKKNAIYVKGKIKGDPVSRVYVLDAKTNRQIGAIDTYSRGQQFRADIQVGSADRVPCMIKVQTLRPSPFFFGGPVVDQFTITIVTRPPEHCSS